MQKTNSLLSKTFLVTLTVLLIASCIRYESDETIQGSGKIISQDRNITDPFQKIEVGNSIDLEIEQADKIEVIVIADKVFQKDIITKVKRGKLIISDRETKTSFSFFGFKRNFSKNNSVKRVIVKLPEIEFLEATSAATIKNKGVIKSEDLELKTSSAARMDLQIESDKIKITANSGSSVNAEGLALSLRINAASGSSVLTQKLIANEIEANSSSGSSISVNPVLTLNAKASSGSNIDYSNNPKTIQKKATSGASITKI